MLRYRVLLREVREQTAIYWLTQQRKKITRFDSRLLKVHQQRLSIARTQHHRKHHEGMIIALRYERQLQSVFKWFQEFHQPCRVPPPRAKIFLPTFKF